MDKMELIISEKEIEAKVKSIAELLIEEYKDLNPVIIGIMRGSIYFLSDLTKEMSSIDLEVDVMCVSSYAMSDVSSGTVQILKDTSIDVARRHVILVEDIIDSGRTIKYLQENFKSRQALSVKTVVIFEKITTNIMNAKADIVGFNVPDDFLVGYGLDYANKYRHLPSVYKILK